MENDTKLKLRCTTEFFFSPRTMNIYFMEHLRFQLEINLEFNSFPKLFMTLREARVQTTSANMDFRGSNYDRKTKANTETNEILKEAGN